MTTFASLARQVAVAAAVVAVATFPSTSAWARGGYGGGGGHGGGGGWHGGGTWHGGSGHGHGGHWGHYGYWPGAFWGGIGVGIGIGAIGYYGGYYGGYYAPYYYGPYYGGYYDAPLVVAPVYSTVEGNGAARSGQPVPQTSTVAEPIFYPRNGQSAEATESDRRECNRWATSQRGAMTDASIFQRATLACMEGRGYTVK
jgi:hypothetical protein